MPGLVPRAITELYALTSRMGGTHDLNMSCYLVELYKDTLNDLLLPKNVKDRPKIEIRFNKDTEQVVLKNAKQVPIRSESECKEVFEHGLEGRKTRATQMNAESSRSHLIFSMIIESTNRKNGKKHIGKLSFIDLAGSEKSSKTGVDAEGAAEAKSINMSLSALGNVISALAEGSGYVSYRTNVLT
jgi:hypothetical protein